MLERRREIGHFVEKQRAALRRFHLAHRVRNGAGKRPFLWPNSVLLISSLESIGQWTVTNGRLARLLCSRIQRASTVLPVPLSPRSSTTESEAAARSRVCRKAA